jgi:hypothetical protein
MNTEVYVHRDEVHDKFLVEYVENNSVVRKEYPTLGETLRKIYVLKLQGYDVSMGMVKSLEQQYFTTA